MKEIPLSRIAGFVGKKIRMDYNGNLIVVDVTVSMGPMYFLVKDGKMIAHIFKNKPSIPAKLYEL